MELKINIPEDLNVQALFGNYDANVKTVEKTTGTDIIMRDGQLLIKGKDT